MKNTSKFFGIIALAALIVFAGCKNPANDDDPSDLPPAGDGSVDFNDPAKPVTYPVFNADGTAYTGGDITFITAYLNTFADIAVNLSEWEVKITGGELSIKLGEVKDEYLEDAAKYCNPFDDPWFEGSTITEGLKVYGRVMGEFSDGTGNAINWKRESGLRPDFLYANKAGSIKGTYHHGPSVGDVYTLYTNMELKQGWNIVIQTDTDEIISEVTGKPGSDVKWTLSN